jgi:prolipoprotein diacylglyceryl transferase
MDIPHEWYGVFAVWSGGLGVWGGIALGALAGAWRVHRAGASVTVFMEAIAPALLVAQAVGRVGNYFNKELFGKPTSLPWGLDIPLQYRPPGYTQFARFQPSFLYELIFDLLLAAALVWLGHHRRIRPPGLFALYVAGYSAYRIFEETIRIDSSKYIFGMRLNFWIALIMTIVGLVWFAWSQVKGRHSPDELANGKTAQDVTPAEPGAAPPGGETPGDEAASDGAPGDATLEEPTGATDDDAHDAEHDQALTEGATPRD